MSPLTGRRLGVDARYLQRRGIGISGYLDTVIRSLARSGAAIELVTDDAGHARALTGEYGLPAVALPATSGFRWEQRLLPVHLAERRYDAYVAGGNYGLPLRRVPGTALVLVVHDLIPLRMPGTYLVRRPAWAAKYLLSTLASAVSADLVIANSYATARDVRLLLLRRRAVTVLYPRVPAAATAPAAPPVDGPYLLYNGGLDPRKNVPQLLAAFASFRWNRPDVRLVLLGAGYGVLDECLRGLGLDDDAVLRPGYVDDETRDAWLRSAAAVVYPSRTEGFGLPIAEALAAGVPVLCGTGGSQPEVGGHAAVYVDVRSEASVVAGLRRVLAPDAQRVFAIAGPAQHARLLAAPGVRDVARVLADLLDSPGRARQYDRAPPSRRVRGPQVSTPATDVRIAVVIPCGPRDDLLDTLDSVLRYTDPSRLVVVVDDTRGRGADLAAARLRSDDVRVILAPAGPAGVYGGLWLKLAAGYRHVLERCTPELVLRLDADALLLGCGLEDAATARFAADPQLGLLGSYRVGPDGDHRDFTPVVRRLARETGLLGLRHPALRSLLRSLLVDARRNGYPPGAHVLGAACVHRGETVRRLGDLGWLDLAALAPSGLGDDHILSLLTVAAGYRIGDFGGPGDPMALRWRGLPAHPEELLRDGKLVTHSVRSWADLDERSVRAVFAAARAQH